MGSAEKHEYLALYDYGMGGIWFKIAACSREQITRRYPQLTLFAEKRADWMTEAQEIEYVGSFRFNLDADEPSRLAILDRLE